ncbi:glycosyltransferase, partial [Chloroflexota bacterium]
MTKLKFVMTTSFYPPYHVGGACLHVKWLAEELARQGHEVHVMFSLDAYEIKRGRVQVVDIEPSAVHLYPLRSPRGRLETLLVYLQGMSTYFSGEFERLLKKVSPDVVHHHNISLLGYDLLRKRGSYLNLYTAHDYWLICQLNDFFRNGLPCTGNRFCPVCALRSRRPPQLWRRNKAFAHAIRDVDLAIAPSNYLHRTLSEKTELSLVTIPNFVPPPPGDIPLSGFSDYFLFVGMLDKHKGIMKLVELFKDYWGEIDARLLVAGTGSLERRLQTYVKKSGLEDVVHFLGWCDHHSLYPLYRDAIALVVPSLCPENCSSVVLEALSLGTPVVASNMGGLPEIAGLQGEGHVCDLPNLKNALIKARNTSPNHQQIQDIYQRHFSPEGFISRYLEL